MSREIFDNKLFAIRKNKNALKLSNLPSLECVFWRILSKILMYEFHFYYIRNKYDNKAKLLFTGTRH